MNWDSRVEREEKTGTDWLITNHGIKYYLDEVTDHRKQINPGQ